MELLQQRQKKVIEWLRHHQGLFIILIATILLVIRIYYFVITLDQPAWWDEGDYLNIARQWAFGSPAWDINPLRPLLFSFLVAILFKVGFGEFFIRLIPFFASIISIVLVYFIGKDLYDRRIGLVSAFMLASFWSFLFFSYRMLVDVPVAMLWLLALFFFIRGYELNKRIFLWLSIPTLVLGFLMKYTGALLGFILLAYLFVIYRLKPLKNRNLWISLGAGILVSLPFFWYEWKKFGHPLAFYISAIGGRAASPRSGWQTLIDYIKTTIPHVETAFLVLFFIGFAIILFELIIGFDLLWKNKEQKLRANFFLFLTFLIPFLYIVSLGYGAYIEERYLFIMYPFMFIIAAKGLFTVTDYIKKYSKIIAVLLIIGVLAFGFYENFAHGNKLIKQKKVSFIQVKEAAEWVRDHSEKDDIIFVHHTQAEFQYASNRQARSIPGINETELIQAMKKIRPKFLVMNIFVPVAEGQEWKVPFPYARTDIFKREISYAPFIDKDNTLPILSVFSITPEFYEEKK